MSTRLNPPGFPGSKTQISAKDPHDLHLVADVKSVDQLPGRRPITYVELDLDFCKHTFGTSPCTATGTHCYNTAYTCKDIANYSPTIKNYRFIEEDLAEAPISAPAIPCLKSVKTEPTRIDPAQSLGRRASVTVAFNDFTHHDRDTDPYTYYRTYKPEEQGTYWGKLKARNKYYQNRTMRVRTGFISDPFDLNKLTSREYLIERIEGPDRNGVVTIIGKDPLKLAEGKRSQCPIASRGKLSAELTDVATVINFVSYIEDYPVTGGKVRIGDEIISYTGVSGLSLTGVTRGTNGTVAKSYPPGTLVQLCKEYANTNVCDVLKDLLILSGVPESKISAVDFSTEKLTWLSSHDLSRIISTPTAISSLISELCEQCLLSVWWDEVNKLVRIKSLSPPKVGQSIPLLTDESHFITCEANDNPEERASQVWVYYNKITPIDDNDPSNYDAYIMVEGDKESSIQYGERRVHKIFSDWLGAKNLGQVIQLCRRLIGKRKDNPLKIYFSLDAKDAKKFWTGDVVDISSAAIQAEDGSSYPVRAQIVSAQEDRIGTIYNYEAVTIGADGELSGRYGFMAKNGSLSYSNATNQEKFKYAYIGDNFAGFGDGGERYKII